MSQQPPKNRDSKSNNDIQSFEHLVPVREFARDVVDAQGAFDDSFQTTLRPRSIGEYIGQEKVKSHVSLALGAAKRRGEALDHILLHGPPGLGKTTLAAVIAHELEVGFKATSGPVLEKPGDLAAILSGLSERDVLFIDEIHRLSRTVEEILYPALEDFMIDIIVGQGPAARSIKLPLKPFTLIGATTRTGLLTAPLRDRFGIIERMDFYTQDELTTILERSARLLDIPIERSAAALVAARSRGTPRIANRLLKRVRDYAEEYGEGKIDQQSAHSGLELLEIDSFGLDKMDRLLLLTLMDKFSGGPVGLDTLAASIHEDKDTVEDVYEPYLLQEGFLVRTPRGREATLRAYQHFGRSVPANRAQLSSANDSQMHLFTPNKNSES